MQLQQVVSSTVSSTVVVALTAAETACNQNCNAMHNIGKQQVVLEVLNKYCCTYLLRKKYIMVISSNRAYLQVPCQTQNLVYFGNFVTPGHTK